MRKVAFASAAVLLQPVGVDVQANIGVAILFVSFALQVNFRPYLVPQLDTIEAAGLVTAFFTLNGQSYPLASCPYHVITW